MVLLVSRISKLSPFRNTVKPVLTTTSEQRPPVNKGQSKPGQPKLKKKC
jgi:hypothetical protein